MYMLVITTINLHIKFKVTSFAHSKNMMRATKLN